MPTTTRRTPHAAGSSMAPGEESLVRGVRAGDDACFAELVHRHGGRMLAVARRILGEEEEAHDCVQDAFLNALKGIAGFEGRASIASWLHRIVVNTALVRLRRRRSLLEEPLDGASARFDAEGCRIEDRALSLRLAEAVFERRESRSLIRKTIAALPDTHRVVLVLRDIEGYDTAETAALLEATPAAVKVRLHRARLALKTALEATIKDTRP